MCTSGLLHARDASAGVPGESGSRVYTIHVSGSSPVAKIEVSVAQPSVEWEVTATYDATGCEIHCSWRRKRDSFGRMPLASFLPPPIATVRIYTNLAPQSPAVIVVDPAGLGLPGVAGDAPITQDAVWIAARRIFAAILPQRGNSGALKRLRAHFLSITSPPEVTSAASLPLRV